MSRKKIFYLGLWGLLGLLVATIVHALIEIPTLRLITGDLERFGTSWVWQHWEVVHGVGSLGLWAAGLLLGLWAGQRYWSQLAATQRQS